MTRGQTGHSGAAGVGSGDMSWPVAGLPVRQLPAWRVRLIKAIRRAQQRARWWLRIRRGVLVNGCWYKETSAIPLQKALLAPPRGAGYKEYRVTFPDGQKLLVRCTPTDILADLMGSVGLETYYKLAPFIRPGMRVLEIGAGSGYRAAWLSQMVSSSGAVVAICSCREMSAFAQKRYAGSGANVAFEVGSPQTLAGEVDGSFDMVFVSGVLGTDGESDTLLAELYRVTRPGGRLVLHVPLGEGASAGHAARFEAGEPGGESEDTRLRENKPPRVVGEVQDRIARLATRGETRVSGASGVSSSMGATGVNPHATLICTAGEGVVLIAIDKPEELG